MLLVLCFIHSLCQPASRRPVAFSPSADMGLTDIEMAHQFDYDDPYFDERPYDVEYEVSMLFLLVLLEKIYIDLRKMARYIGAGVAGGALNMYKAFLSHY